MKEERSKNLRKELKFLIKEEIDRELIENNSKLEDGNISVEEIAREIYLKRGIEFSKLKKRFMDNLIEATTEIFNLFKYKDKRTKSKMYLEIIYTMILLILMKLPFDLVRDIGYEYLELITNNSLYYTIWNLLLLILYTITLLCWLITIIRNFKTKYNDTLK